MSTRATQLAARRLQLQQRCIGQRQQLASMSHEIEARLSGLDRGVKIVSLLTRKPVLITAGIAGIFLFGPARMLRWLGQGTLVLGAIRKLGSLVAKF